MTNFPTTARLAAGAIAFIAAASLIAQPMLRDGSYLSNLGGMVRYFTIWGNIAATLAMGWIAMGRGLPRAVLASLATSLTVVGLVYWALLAGYHTPTGLGWYTNQVHHSFVPIATVAWWFCYTTPAPKIMPMLPTIMAPPLSYGLFAFLLGEATGFYAYFFINLPELGWANFLLNNVGLALFFAALGAVLVALKNQAKRWSNPAAVA
ncbi:MAG: Pr6Pr family membrane protein [Erythrobacter sp.]